MEHILHARGRRAVATVLFAAGLSGCPLPPGGLKIAAIHYSQIGACKTARLPDGTTIDAPPSHAIALFRIDYVDNTSPPVAWQFDPGKFQVNSPSDEQANLGGNGPPIAVPANGKVTVNRPIGIMVAASNPDGSDVANYNYQLLYPMVPPAPGTISVNDTRDRHNFPWNPDCNALIGG